MLTFKHLRYKNFLSTGNQFIEIPLNKQRTNIIVGDNGSGKSTMLDALCFSLFNRPFRKITKSQIVNSQNDKDCLVEIDFDINKIQYKVKRGFKPSIFEIYRKGKKLNEDASAIDQQKTLEQQILKLNFKSFTQIVIIGSAGYIPFMQLSSPHRREVIEDLLDIKVFTSMSDILKQKIKDSRDKIKILEMKKENFGDKIVMQKKFIESVEKSTKTDLDDKEKKIKFIENNIVDFNFQIEKCKAELNDWNEQAKSNLSATAMIKKLVNFKTKIESKKKNVTQVIHFFENNKECPTCTQAIQEKFRINKLEQLSESLKNHGNNISEIDIKISEEEGRESLYNNCQRKITKIQNEISQINVRISESNKQRNVLEQEIQNVANRTQDTNSEYEKLSEYKKDLRDILKDYDKVKEDYNYYLQANKLLKDDGVKSSIIKKYLPLINQQVNRYLQMMDFYINFSFDTEFNEKVESPIHEKFSYPSFSEGEKMRIDLSLLFTWREIARLKNSVATNLLIMDEVFDSSLDSYGTDEFMKIIRFVVKDANIFVISHKNELHDKFETVLEFKKEKGFSYLT